MALVPQPHARSNVNATRLRPRRILNGFTGRWNEAATRHDTVLRSYPDCVESLLFVVSLEITIRMAIMAIIVGQIGLKFEVDLFIYKFRRFWPIWDKFGDTQDSKWLGLYIPGITLFRHPSIARR